MQPKQAHYRRKGVLSLFVSLCLILSSPLVVGDLRGAEPAKSPIGENLEASDTKVLVTYFYTTYRCPTCKKLEAYSRQAIEEGFPKELEEKKIVFRTLNMEEPENQHYAQDYKLYTKSLIISLNRNGKEEKWKNLADIWKLVRSQEKFVEYVQHETQSYLKDL
jgi:hypothetical protein